MTDHLLTPANAPKRRDKKGEKKFIQRQQDPYDFKTTLGDSRFQELNMQQAVALEDFCVRDPTVLTALDIEISAILGGGILLKRHNGTSVSEQELSEFQRVYTTLLTWCIIQEWALGSVFIILEPNPSKPGAFNPRVMYMKDVKAYFHTNVFRRTTWMFREESARNSLSLDFAAALGSKADGIGGRVLRNVFVHTIIPPAPDGSVRSKIVSLQGETSFVETRKGFALNAEGLNSNPLTYTEAREQRPDAILGRVVPDDGLSLSSGSSGSGASADDLIAAKRRRMAERLADDEIRRQVDLANRLGPTNYRAVHQALTEKIWKNLGSENGRRVDIEDDRRLVNGPVAQAPADLIQSQVYRQQMVFMLLGIPPALIQPESTRGRLSENNSISLFQKHVQLRKQQMVAIAKAIYEKCHAAELAEQYTSRIPVDEKITDIPADAMSVEITLPGIPEDSILEKLYAQGLLKYEAYVEHMSVSHSMDQSNFNKSAKIPEGFQPATGQGPKSNASSSGSKGTKRKRS